MPIVHSTVKRELADLEIGNKFCFIMSEWSDSKGWGFWVLTPLGERHVLQFETIRPLLLFCWFCLPRWSSSVPTNPLLWVGWARCVLCIPYLWEDLLFVGFFLCSHESTMANLDREMIGAARLYLLNGKYYAQNRLLKLGMSKGTQNQTPGFKNWLPWPLQECYLNSVTEFSPVWNGVETQYHSSEGAVRPEGVREEWRSECLASPRRPAGSAGCSLIFSLLLRLHHSDKFLVLASFGTMLLKQDIHVEN